MVVVLITVIGAVVFKLTPDVPVMIGIGLIVAHVVVVNVFHMTENDRGLLGEGLVNWDDLFRALNEINFSGRLVLENFSSSISHMAETVSLWRPSKHDAEDLVTGSLRFMREKIDEFSW